MLKYTYFHHPKIFGTATTDDLIKKLKQDIELLDGQGKTVSVLNNILEIDPLIFQIW